MATQEKTLVPVELNAAEIMNLKAVSKWPEAEMRDYLQMFVANKMGEIGLC